MNILFVLYGDLGSNSAVPLSLYCKELVAHGHNCTVAIPENIDSARQFPGATFNTVLYEDVFSRKLDLFPDRRMADVVHAWTPREGVRRFVMKYMKMAPTPLLVYLEDHELVISRRTLRLDDDSLFRKTDAFVSEILPEVLAHPFRYHEFIGLADFVVVIQDKLLDEVPGWVQCTSIMPGVDLSEFYPRSANFDLRRRYGVLDNERVIVYPGGLNEFTRPGIETLCNAVGLINEKGCPCKLLRTGPGSLDFLHTLPSGYAQSIIDVGVVQRNDVSDILSLADVFVQPGRIDPFEDLRLPGKLPEFFSMGRPVITPDVNISYLLSDSVDAVITHDGTAEEIAAKCLDLFSRPSFADAIGRRGRAFAENNFDIKVQAALMSRAYISACNEFDPVVAEALWKVCDVGVSVAQVLARKLSLLYDFSPGDSELDGRRILKEFARYMESQHRRVDGLETEIVENRRLLSDLDASLNSASRIISLREKEKADKDVEIGFLTRALADKDREIELATQEVLAYKESTSWRLSKPIRVVGYLVAKARYLIDICRAAIEIGGGIRPSAVKMLRIYNRDGLAGIKRSVRVIQNSRLAKPVPGAVDFCRNDYAAWVRRYDTFDDAKRRKIVALCDGLPRKPKISIIMPTYNPKPEWLVEAIESVRSQLYPCWELCIADDASPDPSIRQIIERYVREDQRIKAVFRDLNGHISAASNSALALVSGEWVALLDHDDLLAEHALVLVAESINRHPSAGIVYSDEDKIDEAGNRSEPHFKCEWNIDLFRSQNMISHLGVYRRELVSAVGGFREGFEGSQDYDLALRIIESLPADRIIHIPYVLYHWRVHENSTASSGLNKTYAQDAGIKALREHFFRLDIDAEVVLTKFLQYRIKYPLPSRLPKVSLIIPTKNGLQLLRRCLDSILSKTAYNNYEVVVIDNGSDDPETLAYFREIDGNKNVSVVRDDRPFNYSALNNRAISNVDGEYVALLNNDLEVITPEWLGEMLSLASRDGIGAVGATLWYPDDSLQHGGVITGLGGVAGHSHKGLPRGGLGYFCRARLTQGLSAVTAACLLVKRSIYLEVGGLNEADLQVAFNDVDFCLKVRAAGYQNVWTPFAELYHHESATRGFEDTPEKQARFSREIEYMKRTWGELLLNDPSYSPNLTLDHEDFSLAWPPRVDLFK